MFRAIAVVRPCSTGIVNRRTLVLPSFGVADIRNIAMDESAHSSCRQHTASNDLRPAWCPWNQHWLVNADEAIEITVVLDVLEATASRVQHVA